VASLAIGLLGGCAPAAAPRPSTGALAPTACERSALMSGRPPDVSSPEAVAEGLRWGVLAPETCPEPGRLDVDPPVRR
jgi:hypothetical protein